MKVRFSTGIPRAPSGLGLSHRAYVDALRSPGDVTGTHIALSQPRGRIGLAGSMVRLVHELARRRP